jgi:hypothetical protein
MSPPSAAPAMSVLALHFESRDALLSMNCDNLA